LTAHRRYTLLEEEVIALAGPNAQQVRARMAQLPLIPFTLMDKLHASQAVTDAPRVAACAHAQPNRDAAGSSKIAVVD
jgi:hypothetical protein